MRGDLVFCRCSQRLEDHQSLLQDSYEIVNMDGIIPDKKAEDLFYSTIEDCKRAQR